MACLEGEIILGDHLMEHRLYWMYVYVHSQKCWIRITRLQRKRTHYTLVCLIMNEISSGILLIMLRWTWHAKHNIVKKGLGIENDLVLHNSSLWQPHACPYLHTHRLHGSPTCLVVVKKLLLNYFCQNFFI